MGKLDRLRAPRPEDQSFRNHRVCGCKKSFFSLASSQRRRHQLQFVVVCSNGMMESWFADDDIDDGINWCENGRSVSLNCFYPWKSESGEDEWWRSGLFSAQPTLTKFSPSPSRTASLLNSLLFIEDTRYFLFNYEYKVVMVESFTKRCKIDWAFLILETS